MLNEQPLRDLAPLTRVLPENVAKAKGGDRLGEFVLGLSLFFNDLKDLLLLLQVIAPAKRPDGEITSAAGQWAGLHLHLQRLVMSSVHEMLALFDKFAEVAEGPEISAYLDSASPQIRRYWRALVATSTGKTDTTSDRQFAVALVKIRNNLTSHYYQPKKLLEGYRQHFFVEPKAPNNLAAFVSLGHSMTQTRFYFADAAAQRGLELMLDDGGPRKRFVQRLQRHVEFANNAIEHVVRTHLTRVE